MPDLLWYPNAIVRQGPSDKHGYPNTIEPGQKRGLVVHSMVGFLAGALAELDNEEKRVSWTFSNPKIGPIIQHYPLGFHTWANGNAIPNVAFASIEHEGGPLNNVNEPLNENQIDNLVGLIKWLGQTQGWIGYKRPVNQDDLSAQLYEHKEMIRFKSSPTACPSNRIPWTVIIPRLTETFNPTPRDVSYAGGAAATFMATGRPLAELHPYDKAVLKWIAQQV